MASLLLIRVAIRGRSDSLEFEVDSGGACLALTEATSVLALSSPKALLIFAHGTISHGGACKRVGDEEGEEFLVITPERHRLLTR
jgi:hypothetical protein